MRARSGAAGRAVECSGKLWNGSTGSNWGLHGGHADPARALRRFMDEPFSSLPSTGYRVERDEPGRVLYSYDVDGRTKVAVIVSNLVPQQEEDGWSVETFAMCDPAEWPADVTDELGLGVWSDRGGKRVPTSILVSAKGPEHCDWQSATILSVNDKTYYRDPEGVLPSAWFETRYDGRAELPLNAKDTGYRRNDQQLWVAADRSAVNVVNGDHVERWPAPVKPGGCA